MSSLRSTTPSARCTALLALLPLISAQPLRLANIFNSHMVLQSTTNEQHNAIIWGWGTPNASVLAYLSGSLPAQTTIDTTGHWRLKLFKQSPGYVGQPCPNLTVSDSVGSPPIVLTDVCLGDVFVCGGGGGMVLTVPQALNGSQETGKAGYGYFNWLRVMTVGPSNGSANPLTELASIEQPWTPASPASIGGGNWSTFSAACWFMGAALVEERFYDGGPDYPIGLIVLAAQDAPLSAWTSAAGVAQCDPPSPSPFAPSSLYNAVIAPFSLGPICLRGALWWGGWDNVGDTAPQFSCRLTALINDWRTALQSPWFSANEGWWALPLLPPWLEAAGNDTSALWAGQLAVADALPGVVLTSAADLGDPSSPWGSANIRWLQALGGRVAALVMADLFEKPGWAPAQLPRAGEAHSPPGLPPGTLRADVAFTRAGEPVVLSLTPLVPGGCPAGTPSGCTPEVLTGSDGVEYNVTSRVLSEDRTTVAFVATGVPAGVVAKRVRGGWGRFPVHTVYSAGPPANHTASFPVPVAPFDLGVVDQA